MLDIETLEKAEYVHQQAKVMSLNASNSYVGGYIDACGLGGPLAEYINRSPNCSTIEGFVTTGANKPKQYEQLRSKIFERKLHFAKHLQAAIVSEFSKISRMTNDKGAASYIAQRDSDGHCDRTSALVLALQAMHDKPASFKLPQTWSMQSVFGIPSRSRLN